MATFYLLPARGDLTRQWGRYFRQWFPGLAEPGVELPDLIAEMLVPQRGVHVIFADDLPDDGGAMWEMLEDAFGAEPGDKVIDVRNSPQRMAA